MPKIVRVTLVGASPISFSKAIATVRDKNEDYEAFEARTWKERLHTTPDGICYIPGQALKLAMENAAQYLGDKIPGQGNKTYRAKYMAGLMSYEPMSLGIHKDDVGGERLFVPADGRRGGPKRVWKTFPHIPEGWRVTGEMNVLDELLCDRLDDVKSHLVAAGKYVGFGRFRPANGGSYGRFSVEGFDVSDLA